MDIEILELITGARKASGLAVIIDVFRAFSLECYLCEFGAGEIRPVETIEETFAWREKDRDCVLVGERKGKMCEGFDFGNSPSTVDPVVIRGRRVIHTTSAGTQGIVNAVNAEEIITGSLVNASAVARYIVNRRPSRVSLVCMGTGGVVPNREDRLCAEYIKSMILGEEMPDLCERVRSLRTDGGEHFFDPDNQEVFPERDFWMCTECSIFDFVLRIERDALGLIAEKIPV
ncbi:MAG TPA: 2-phosphosulfolactate phosphatase [Lachnospiraceae bacterium]|nr:2-phosphosulfolactate phosphatase [Lachnospiraceae bacterium]